MEEVGWVANVNGYYRSAVAAERAAVVVEGQLPLQAWRKSRPLRPLIDV